MPFEAFAHFWDFVLSQELLGLFLAQLKIIKSDTNTVKIFTQFCTT